jgi:hypothetical protein
MQQEDLLIYKSDVHSQNGEDGIIAAIFDRIGYTTKTCCEFGAWDGLYLSNCRNLILEGWGALLIEADPRRFDDLVRNYKSNPSVICVNRFVDTGSNSLDSILRAHQMSDLDFLSIDIDGLDYEIFEALETRPRVICIEVNAAHSPDANSRLDRDIAKKNVGQPLQVFVEIAKKKGYDLVCYTGNAFFVLRSVRTKSSLPELSCEQAYQYFIDHLTTPLQRPPTPSREYLYLVNLGITHACFRYHNPYLTRSALGISRSRLVRMAMTVMRAEGARILGYIKSRPKKMFTRKNGPTPT